MGKVLNSTEQAWCDDLLLRLRLRDVPGARIGEVLAEVQSHVAETGEHPREAFGPPKEYAARVADALGAAPSRGWRDAVRGLSWQDLATAAAIGVSSYLLADGLWALGAGGTTVLGLAAWAVCAVAALALADGLWALGAGARTTAGLPTWLVCLGAALVLGACTARFVVTARHDPDADPVVDPRDGADMVPFGRRQMALLAALPVLALVGMVVGGLLSR